ncbi:MAG: hypothetical protein HRU70_08835 [Phycisphaeraceae bacterium]|nr:MAG: hypothetical protein HRU70_08835 [Phycisphaeraceae bacterium]
MASSFKGLDMFGSGPHRFAVGRRGQFVVSGPALGVWTPETYPLGLVELEVVVKGRLVSSSEAGLWAQRDAVVAQLLNPPTRGTLIDHHGRAWTQMSFITYEEGDRTDRGRARSVGYTAVFRRFTTDPG